MFRFPKLTEVWRVLKDADLEAIRREAERPFQILIASEDIEDAEALAVLLTGESDGSRHPWLLPSLPEDARRAAASGLIDVALVVSRTPDASAALQAVVKVLQVAKVPTVTVVNGITSRTAAVARAGETARVAITTLEEPQSLATVIEALLPTVPSAARLGLARHLPPLRAAVFDQLIEDTAKTNATYALTTGVAEAVPVLDVPLNIADIVILTKNQLVMSYRIAVGAGKEGSPREVIGEVMGVIGSGFLFRQATRSLIGLIPVAGIVPKVAVAYAGTWAVGRAVVLWADGGEQLSKATMKKFYAEAWHGAKAFAEGLAAGARKAPRRLFKKRAALPPGSAE